MALIVAALAFAMDPPAQTVRAIASPRPTPTLMPSTPTPEATPEATAEVTAPPTARPATARPVVRTSRPVAPRAATAPPQPVSRPGSITAAFYYTWYPGPFDSLGTRYHPSAGKYSSQDPAVIAKHIQSMRYAGVQAAIASWWGAGDGTDTALGRAMDSPGDMKWSIYYELEGPQYPNKSPDQLRADLQYIKDRYANRSNYLKINGRPVIFVWPDPNDGCAMVQRWRDANTLGFYVVQKVFPGSTGCTSVSDSWHQYSPDKYSIEAKGFSYAVSPGFWRPDEASARLARDPAKFEAAVSAMRSSSAQWKLLTTFNEWGEGTAVESADEWASASGYGTYVDILHKYFG